MTIKEHYQIQDPNIWQGRADTPPTSNFFQIVQFLNLMEKCPQSVDQPTFALLGFQCDEGIRRNLGRVGAADGPQALRQALAKLPVQKYNFTIYDAGNITCHNQDLESAQKALADCVNMLIRHHIIPIVVGGGHELAWGHYQGIAQAHPQKELGIINFDAHFDMRPLLPNGQGTSGTPFLQIAKALEAAHNRFDYNVVGVQHAGNIRQLIETAKYYNSKIIWADEIHQGQFLNSVDFIDRIIDENDVIYTSICLDVFAAAYAPGVSATQPLGLLPWQIIPLIRQLAASGKVTSYDIAELSPKYDIDLCTAKLAANLIYEIIHHHSNITMPW